MWFAKDPANTLTSRVGTKDKERTEFRLYAILVLHVLDGSLVTGRDGREVSTEYVAAVVTKFR